MTTEDVSDQTPDDEVRAALDGAMAATPDQLVSRGSFAAYADDDEEPAPHDD